MNKYLIILIFSFFSLQEVSAQNLDSLFNEARTLAFNKKTEKAREICYSILEKDANYIDAKLLIGKTLSWDKKYNLARVELLQALKLKPNYKDLSLTIIDNELWSGNYKNAEKQCNTALLLHKNDKEILWKKARAQEKLGKKEEAIEIIEFLLKAEKKNEKYLAYYSELTALGTTQKLGFEYSFDYFKQPYIRNAHIVSVSYTYQTPKFTLVPRVNNGHLLTADNTFLGESGFQFELDAYLNVGEKKYIYLNYGISDSTFFPKHRAGIEYFTSLPFEMEASLGMRYLQFISANTPANSIYIFTGSLGIYLGNYWLSFRPFITPQNKEISQSYNLTMRRYFKKSENYMTLTLGTGNSPDDPTRNTGDINIYKLKATKLRVGFQKELSQKVTTKITAGIAQEEYENGKFRTAFGTYLAFFIKL